MFFRFLQVAIVNAHIIYTECCSPDQKPLNQQHFVLSVIGELLGEAVMNRLRTVASSVRKLSSGDQVQTETQHWITKLDQPEPTDDKRCRSEKNCAHCSGPSLRKRTSFYCPACPGQPGLHPECFKDYHLKRSRN